MVWLYRPNPLTLFSYNGDDGVDYFVHFSFITDGSMLRENDRVSFDPEETERGKQAKNVTKLASGEPSE
jgi:cold shock CspA family protein